MSSSTQEKSGGTSAAAASQEILSSKEIDASCRFPVLVLFLSASFWFLVSAVLGLLVSIKLHSGGFLASCPWLTYGRIRPVQLDALVYGFAVPAAFGLMLWLFCRLGRTRLAAPLVLVIATIIWNIGVLIGSVGVLVGDSTGFEWLEYPRYALPFLFIAYACIGVCAVLTFRARRPQQLYPSQWCLLAALFWFAWIFSAAILLLVCAPVRGVVQICVNAWYASNLLNVWLSAVGLGAIFYFIPKLTGRPLYSHYLSLLAFWGIALFGGWGLLPVNAPLPSWIPALSAVMAIAMILPILGVALNLRGTMAGYRSTVPNPILSLVLFGSLSFVLAQSMNVLSAIRPVNKFLAFTYFNTAQTHWMLVGFFASVIFGAVYYIVPLLLDAEPFAALKVRFNALVLFTGVIFYGAALAIGGVAQGLNLNNPEVAFPDVVKGTMPFLYTSTLGSLLLVVAGFLFFFNLLSFGCRACCACCNNSGKAEVRP